MGIVDPMMISFLRKAGLALVAFRRLPDGTGTQYKVQRGKQRATINVYDTGRWLVQGEHPEIVPRDRQLSLLGDA